MKRTKYPIHPDFKKWENMNPPLNRAIVPVLQRVIGLLFEREKSTAEFDCLRDGGILYAERLQLSGVPAEMYNTKGTMHGFDIVLDSQIVRECVERRIAFLRRGFGNFMS